jgi:N-acetylmuramic acid 6-phosphate etherase
MKRTSPSTDHRRFLGIECGATKSVSILAAADGHCCERLEGNTPANLRLLDGPGLDGLLRGIARHFPRPDAVGIGMAGVLDAADRVRLRTAAGQVWPAVPCWVGNDLESALAAADDGANVTAGAARVIVISGTGASCFGKTAAGGEILTGGWGHLLGDRGSGYDIALRACQAVFAGLDESGRWPALGVRLLTVLQLNSPAEMVSWHGRATKAETAALAVEVFAAAAKGDKTAKSILNEAAAAITRSATACAGRLTRKGNRVEFVLTGSILIKQRGFSRLVERQLAAAWPVATVRVLRREAAWGALEMARRACPPGDNGGRVDVSDRNRPSPQKESGLIPAARGLSPTEQRNPRSQRLDRMTVPAAIRLMLEEDAEIPAALLREQRKIRKAIDLIVAGLRQGGRMFYVGAGTSGRLGVLDAYECPPTFNVSPDLVQAILAGGGQAMQSALEDAEDDIEGGAHAVHCRGVARRDVVIGIAASGRTPFVWGALHAAREIGATTILVCFNPNLVFNKENRPDLVIAPRVGPEVLTGSTRLKAGTATKLLLNLFTTLSMVRMGKVVENLMVDVQPTNAKLRLRAIRIVRELSGLTAEAAESELVRHGWAVKQTLDSLPVTARDLSGTA